MPEFKHTNTFVWDYEKEHSSEGEALESVGVITRLSDDVMSMAHNYMLQNTNVLVAFTFT